MPAEFVLEAEGRVACKVLREMETEGWEGDSDCMEDSWLRL